MRLLVNSYNRFKDYRDTTSKHHSPIQFTLFKNIYEKSKNRGLWAYGLPQPCQTPNQIHSKPMKFQQK